MKRRGYPKYVSETKDRHGKYRLRYRFRGMKTYYFKARYGTPEFETELALCREGGVLNAPEPTSRYIAGTIGDLVTRYYSSPALCSKRTKGCG